MQDRKFFPDLDDECLLLEAQMKAPMVDPRHWWAAQERGVEGRLARILSADQEMMRQLVVEPDPVTLEVRLLKGGTEAALFHPGKLKWAMITDTELIWVSNFGWATRFESVEHAKDVGLKLVEMGCGR